MAGEADPQRWRLEALVRAKLSDSMARHTPVDRERRTERDERGRNGRSTGRRRKGRRSSGSGGVRARARGQRSGLRGLLSSRWSSATRARGVAGCMRLVVLDGGGAPLLLGSSEATRRK
uniref:Uncharacterized protein n=1 Tax=Triticum urartu TaxID=4572 RepID=A0A8R7QTP8_TRIUA